MADNMQQVSYEHNTFSGILVKHVLGRSLVVLSHCASSGSVVALSKYSLCLCLC